MTADIIEPNKFARPKALASEPEADDPELPTVFQQTFAAWLAARANSYRCPVGGLSEDDLAEALEEEREAVWSVIQAPTDGLVEVKQRARFVLALFTDALERGQSCDRDDLHALVGLVAAIHRL